MPSDEILDRSAVISKIFIGASILADVVSMKRPELAPMFLMGNYDEQIRYFVYTVVHEKNPRTQTDLFCPLVLERLEAFKDEVRRTVQVLINAEQDRFHNEIQDRHDNVIAVLKDSCKPHHLGTVSEIATRYGISKSEVRRRKADGTLDQFITDLPST